MLVDVLGNNLAVGDKVAYVSLCTKTAYQRIGTITKIFEKERPGRWNYISRSRDPSTFELYVQVHVTNPNTEYSWGRKQWKSSFHQSKVKRDFVKILPSYTIEEIAKLLPIG